MVFEQLHYVCYSQAACFGVLMCPQWALLLITTTITCFFFIVTQDAWYMSSFTTCATA